MPQNHRNRFLIKRFLLVFYKNLITNKIALSVKFQFKILLKLYNCRLQVYNNYLRTISYSQNHRIICISLEKLKVYID